MVLLMARSSEIDPLQGMHHARPPLASGDEHPAVPSCGARFEDLAHNPRQIALGGQPGDRRRRPRL